mmetsp:Transcript_132615/g.383386  ORF Transcript_132615/g.383386 Transcript_132615/m.383386 type:complete len:269 (-) Transcript_132615:152-958(-)
MGALSSRSEEVVRQVKEVFRSDAEWREIEELVNKRMRPKHIRHYKCKMAITRIFKILPSDSIMRHMVQLQDLGLGSPKLLFHGTTPARAERILKDGFSLPPRPGMFGKGIYFAKDPLKSVRYAAEGTRGRNLERQLSEAEPKPAAAPEQGTGSGAWDWMSSIGAWVSSAIGDTFSGGETVRHMLLCEVYLGKTRTLRFARPKLDPAKDLRRGWLWKRFGAREYNSVRAPGGFLGAVKVTEYVIYSPLQAIPKFLIEFDRVPIDARAAG